MRQPDLFRAAHHPRTPDAAEAPDPDAIRARLYAMLDLVRGASAMPWTRSRAGTQEILFRNMANWLPDGVERETLRRLFDSEMKRLRAGRACLQDAAPGESDSLR